MDRLSAEFHELGSEAVKLEKLEKLCEGKPDALYLLSGISKVTKPNSERKIYKPGSFADVDWNGYMTGGKARALAIAELARYFPEAVVAVNSNTFNIRDPQAPTDAEVMAEYLARSGVNRERMVLQDRSTTTFTELIELIKYTADRNWKHPIVIAGETQLPRAKEMLLQIKTLKDPAGAWKDPVFREALDKLNENPPKITFVAAEKILPIRDERYSRLIAAARKTETWKTREELDKQAVEDLKAGRYWQKK